LFSLTAQKKGIELLNRISDPYSIEADPNMMTTILGNLIGNAIKFSYPGNKVIISAKSNDNFIEISVSDTGTGMSMEDQQRLFRLDTKIKQNGTLNEQGTGLGLILCREFIEKQGGKIWVESQPGKGSTFIVTVIKATDHETN
jgi:signal transduction histidine kinase